MSPGLNELKDASYQYRDSHYKPETVVRLSQVYNGDSYTGVRPSLFSEQRSCIQHSRDYNLAEPGEFLWPIPIRHLQLSYLILIGFWRACKVHLYIYILTLAFRATKYSVFNKLISIVLMPWPLASPEYQIRGFLCFTRKDLSYLCHHIVEKW